MHLTSTAGAQSMSPSQLPSIIQHAPTCMLGFLLSHRTLLTSPRATEAAIWRLQGKTFGPLYNSWVVNFPTVGIEREGTNAKTLPFSPPLSPFFPFLPRSAPFFPFSTLVRVRILLETLLFHTGEARLKRGSEKGCPGRRPYPSKRNSRKCGCIPRILI